MERQKFEDEWKDAFSKAEVTPSDNLWTNIELDLMKAEGEKMKRRLVFYKLMAAASIAFAMCVAGIGVYYYNNLSGKDNQLSSTATQTIQQQKTYDQAKEKANAESRDSNVKATTTSTNLANNTAATSINKKDEDNGDGLNSNSRVLKEPTSSKQSISVGEGVAKNKIGNDEIQHSINLTGTPDDAKANNNIENGQVVNAQISLHDNSNFTEDKVPSLYTPIKILLTFPETQPDPVLVMIAKLEQREIELRGDMKSTKKESKNKELKERFWTTVGFAAGTFASGNSNVYAASNAQTTPSSTFGRSASTNNKVSNQSKSSGSYSLGLSVGTKLSKHWVLQGGVNYLAQNSTFAVNSVIETSEKDFRVLSTLEDMNQPLIAQSSNSTLDPNADRVVATSGYDVNNNSQFISVPVQAGYMAVNRKFGVQVNAGISTDLFLKNTIDAGSKSSLPKATQKGEDSFYRPVNFSGLFGTEISYRLGSHYRVSVIPGLRYPFNSIYKDQVNVVSTPLTLDLGMKFRYIFH